MCHDTQWNHQHLQHNVPGSQVVSLTCSKYIDVGMRVRDPAVFSSETVLTRKNKRLNMSTNLNSLQIHLPSQPVPEGKYHAFANLMYDLMCSRLAREICKSLRLGFGTLGSR